MILEMGPIMQPFACKQVSESINHTHSYKSTLNKNDEAEFFQNFKDVLRMYPRLTFCTEWIFTCWRSVKWNKIYLGEKNRAYFSLKWAVKYQYSTLGVKNTILGEKKVCVVAGWSSFIDKNICSVSV